MEALKAPSGSKWLNAQGVTEGTVIEALGLLWAIKAEGRGEKTNRCALVADDVVAPEIIVEPPFPYTRTEAGIRQTVTKTVKEVAAGGEVGTAGLGHLRPQTSIMLTDNATRERSRGSGSLSLDGRPTVIEGPDRATALGLSFIHQELHLVEQMDVLENITLGWPKPTRFGLVNWSRVAEVVSPVAQRVGINFSLTSTVSALSTAQKWLVSICRALVRQSRLIVMDEPTASLSAAETESLLRIVRELAREQVAVLYVSHRLDEILELCDRVTAFRDGRRVGEIDRSGLTRRRLVEAIVGADVTDVSLQPWVRSAEPTVLQVERLRRGPAVRDVTFALHRGEVLGLAGLVGAGRSETTRIIFGADRAETGKMLLDGVEFLPRSLSRLGFRLHGIDAEKRMSSVMVLSALSTMSDTGSVCAGLGGPFTGR